MGNWIFMTSKSHIDESTESYQTSVVGFSDVALDCSFEPSKAQSPSRGELDLQWTKIPPNLPLAACQLNSESQP